MRIGIIGIGVIGSAIVEGFCFNDDQEHEIFISPRNQEKSQKLAADYTAVTRCSSNQEVLDQSDIIMISLLPQNGMNILKDLNFEERHRVINLMSDKQLDAIEKLIGKTKSLNHLVPLSFISKREGPIALYPKNAYLENILAKLGHVIAVNDLEKIQAIAAITGLMTSYYNLLNEVSKWGQNNGLSYEEAKDYTSSFFESLSQHAKGSDLEILASEMTPGGLNELGIKTIHSEDALRPWIQVLDPMLKRLKK